MWNSRQKSWSPLLQLVAVMLLGRKISAMIAVISVVLGLLGSRTWPHEEERQVPVGLLCETNLGET